MNFGPRLRAEPPATGNVCAIRVRGANFAARRRSALQRVNRELSKGNFKTAFSLVKQMQGKPSGLRGFGAAKQIWANRQLENLGFTVKINILLRLVMEWVPKRLSALDELESFDGIELLSIRPLVDSVLDSIQRSIEEPYEDEARESEAECLIHDESSKTRCEYYRNLCVQHEAGHFLIGYLLGALPKGYKIPSIEDIRHGNLAAGKVNFWGFEFLREVGLAEMMNENKGESFNEVTRGKISSKKLNQFLCIKLGGLVAEYLVFGRSEGLHSDVDKLDKTLEWLGFSRSEADLQMRWAALNTVFVLHRHSATRSRLVEAMASGQPVGFCIDAIENAIYGKEI